MRIRIPKNSLSVGMRHFKDPPRRMPERRWGRDLFQRADTAKLKFPGKAVGMALHGVRPYPLLNDRGVFGPVARTGREFRPNIPRYSPFAFAS